MTIKTAMHCDRMMIPLMMMTMKREWWSRWKGMKIMMVITGTKNVIMIVIWPHKDQQMKNFRSKNINKTLLPTFLIQRHSFESCGQNFLLSKQFVPVELSRTWNPKISKKTKTMGSQRNIYWGTLKINQTINWSNNLQILLS